VDKSFPLFAAWSPVAVWGTSAVLLPVFFREVCIVVSESAAGTAGARRVESLAVDLRTEAVVVDGVV
jgi:hypothetical protein